MVDITTEQVLPITFKVVDGRGRTVATEGNPTVASSDETVATVDALTNNSNVWSGNVNSIAPGTARISVSADADLGEGVNTVTGLLDVNVTLDPRTGARITDLEAGTPADKPV